MARGSTTLRPKSTVILLTLSFTGVNWVNAKCPNHRDWCRRDKFNLFRCQILDSQKKKKKGVKYFQGLRQLSTRVVFNAVNVTPNTSFSFLFSLIVKPQELALLPLYRRNSILLCMIWYSREKNSSTSWPFAFSWTQLDGWYYYGSFAKLNIINCLVNYI